MAKSAGFSDDRSLVRAVARAGNALAYLKALGLRAAHVVPVPWRDATQRVPIRVTATLHQKENGSEIAPLLNGEVISRGRHIRFSAFVGVVGALPKGWAVRWRVTNTGAEAAARKNLRGDLVRSGKSGTVHWEHTAYIGVHWVEAFVVNSRGQCVGRSDPFYVVIDDEQTLAAA